MHRIQLLLLLIILLPGLLLPNSIGLASSGLPGSVEFGYGARLDLNGNNPDGAIQIAHSFGLDWVAIDFNWQQQWPELNGQPDTSTLFRLTNIASQRGLNVLLSVSNPPPWVMNQFGPDADTTAWLVETLVSAFPETILAVELFPGANTRKAWGQTPDPHGYLLVLQAVDRRLRLRGFPAVIIPGLETGIGSPEGDMEDIGFLRALYSAGAPPVFPIVGLRFLELTGMPAQEPSANDVHLLRRYELVRSVMVSSGHDSDMIWITGMTWPKEVQSAQDQSVWIGQAYSLLKRQPFIGAAFFTWLNIPGQNNSQASPFSLVGEDLRPSSAAEAIYQVSSNTFPYTENLTNSDSKVNDSITAELQSTDGQNYNATHFVKIYIGKSWLRKGG